MASMMITGITSSSQIGAYRVLTPDFLQYRQAFLRVHQSDSEEVRWVSTQSVYVCKEVQVLVIETLGRCLHVTLKCMTY